MGLPHLTAVASVALPRRPRGEYRCPYGSGKPLWLALSSFHPPNISIAADFQVVAPQAWRGLPGDDGLSG